MSTFRVRASSLGEVAAQLTGVVAVFDGHVASVSGSVAAVSGSTWLGADQEAFAERFASWQQTTELVRMSLTTLAAQLVAAEAAYTSVESTVQSGLVRQRQANETVVEVVEEVDESVDTGLDRMHAADSTTTQTATVGAALTARSGRNDVQGTVAAVRPSSAEGGDDE